MVDEACRGAGGCSRISMNVDCIDAAAFFGIALAGKCAGRDNHMRFRALALGAALAAAGAPAASAAVTGSQFPPQTVTDLIAICAPAEDDPLMAAALGFCHGFAEGAVIVEEAHEEQRGGRKLFCLPSPRPSRGSEVASFIAWANERPTRLQMPAIDGIFIYLAGKYPCPATAAGERRAR